MGVKWAPYKTHLLHTHSTNGTSNIKTHIKPRFNAHVVTRWGKNGFLLGPGRWAPSGNPGANANWAPLVAKWAPCAPDGPHLNMPSGAQFLAQITAGHTQMGPTDFC